MVFRYTPHGVCSHGIVVEIDDLGHLKSAEFMGGCNGNLQGISKLVEGMPVEEVIRRTEGIRCGRKNTSCPDQLAQALKAAINAK